ncbi:MAG: tetratricopeptide repeat protein [Spirochaetaceae bacterium]|nr:tetratricopeptide repeat protein [Spirochaetaceae bacterium]
MTKDTAYPDQNRLREEYERYSENRRLITKDLEAGIEEIVRGLNSRPTVKVRSKDFTSYFKKYIRLLKTSSAGTAGVSPHPVITDLIGIRIVCPFIEDLETVEEVIKKHYEVIEVDRKGSDHTFREFGYQSIHLLIKIPQSILANRGPADSEIAEIQIRTILQDAWAEVEHELVYKAAFTPFDDPMKRKLAAVNANLCLADIIFQEIRSYQRQLNHQLGQRRDSFFKKIEESTDALLFADEQDEPLPGPTSVEPRPFTPSNSIDDLLLNALYAHNKNEFPQAILFYSRILDMNPDNFTRSLIYKHRGMAYFAQSQYEGAINDFTQSLELDPASYKAAYYRGVVRAVLQQYSQAIDDYSLSLNIHPYQPFCLYRRGQAYYHINDYPQALADCEAVLGLDPKFESAKKLRRLLLDKLKM